MKFLIELIFYFVVLFSVSFDNNNNTKNSSHLILSPRQGSVRPQPSPPGEQLCAQAAGGVGGGRTCRTPGQGAAGGRLAFLNVGVSTTSLVLIGE